jgi:histidyl-tRNA synthetase
VKSQNRIESNPLRILDDNEDKLLEVVKKAPELKNILTDTDNNLYSGFKGILDAINIKYVENKNLVRGLDYYNGLVFEFIDSSGLTIAGGGEYSIFASKSIGKELKATGVAIGLDRITDKVKPVVIEKIQVQVLTIDEDSNEQGISILNSLREKKISAQGDFSKRKIGKKMDPEHFNFAIIIGKKELESGVVKIKNFESKLEEDVNINRIVEFKFEAKNE